MDKYQSKAAEMKPHDYVRVRSGRILPDDLIWSWTQGEYFRADDPDWLDKCEFVAQCVYVVRKQFNPARTPLEKRMEIQKETPETVDDLERDNILPAQQSLFSGF